MVYCGAEIKYKCRTTSLSWSSKKLCITLIKVFFIKNQIEMSQLDFRKSYKKSFTSWKTKFTIKSTVGKDEYLKDNRYKWLFLFVCLFVCLFLKCFYKRKNWICHPTNNISHYVNLCKNLGIFPHFCKKMVIPGFCPNIGRIRG